MVFESLISTSDQLAIPAWALAVLLVWTIIWKGLALWKSARQTQPIWFVVLLIVNTAGLLEILYIFFFSRIRLRPAKRGKIKVRKQKPLDLDITHPPKKKSKKKTKKKRR